jgi:hypothetical protein
MIPIYIYCCKEKPYLQGYTMFDGSDDNHVFRVVDDPRDWDIEMGGANLDSYDPLNGHIVARCESKEAFEACLLINLASPCFYSKKLDYRDFLKRSCLTEKEVNNYLLPKNTKLREKYDLFAIHLEHVTPCDLDLSEFYKDSSGKEPMTRAPQSYCHAYRKILITKEEFGNPTFPESYYVHWLDDGTYFRMEPCYIFADHSTYCADILNGEKDLELRKTAPKKLKRK